MENNQPKPKRVLWLSDFACSTGFATVAHNVLAQVAKTKRYQIDVIGINYYGIPNDWQKYYPAIRILPATTISNGDLFGRMGLLNLLTSGVYDILFTLQDTFVIEPISDKIIEIRNALMANNQKAFRWIFYYPIDTKPMDNWIQKGPMLADFPISYTEYGKKESLLKAPSMERKIRTIPHGIDSSVFFPIEDREKVKEFRSKYFLGRADGKFLVTNVNRNQPRKDIMRTIQIFASLKKQVPNALLYLHMKAEDVGGNVHEIVRHFDLIPNEDYIVPADFNEHTGVDTSVLNYIYNSSDVIMTTTLGEGWGLSMTEAMACKTPVIAPDHTSLTEMLSDGKGVLVSAGKRLSDWTYQGASDNNRVRPVVDVAEYVDKLVAIKNYPEKTKEMVEKAYKYVTENLTWDKVGEQWKQTFQEAEEPRKKITIGRNDKCWCGSGKKYKHCHLETDG